MSNGKNLYLTGPEATFASMVVISLLETLQENSSNPEINWTPESR